MSAHSAVVSASSIRRTSTSSVTGKLDIINEAEVPSIIYKTFTSLGLQRFKIRINNRKVLNGFFAILGLTEKAGDVMRTIDKLEKIGAEKVKTILVEDFGVEAAAADELLKFIETPGGTEGILAALEATRAETRYSTSAQRS